MAQMLSSADLVTRFIDETMSREGPVQAALRTETRKLPRSGMMSRPESDALLQLLIKLTGAKRVIEVGTFTGAGTLAMALALPEDGRIVTCDINDDWSAIGLSHWQRAGIAHKIDRRIAPATLSIEALLSNGAAGTFDMAFIDADKPSYDAYYEGCLKLLRQGGLMVLDNMLWGGDVANETASDRESRALRTLNLKIKDDTRVDFALLSADDGIMLAYKR